MALRCISFDSYIKPQPLMMMIICLCVVYLLIPTSNHNSSSMININEQLYIFWFLHQTTTLGSIRSYRLSCISFDSYIKPQLRFDLIWYITGCISFDSYIKPQREHDDCCHGCVVYLLIPTSNHNWCCCVADRCFVVYLLIPTSNHNH